MVAAQRKQRKEGAQPTSPIFTHAGASLDPSHAPNAPPRNTPSASTLDDVQRSVDLSLVDACVALAKAEKPSTSLDNLLLVSRFEHALMHEAPSSPEAPVTPPGVAQPAPFPEDLDAMRKDLAAANQLCDQVHKEETTKDIAEELAAQLFPDMLAPEPSAVARPPLRPPQQNRKMQHGPHLIKHISPVGWIPTRLPPSWRPPVAAAGQMVPVRLDPSLLWPTWQAV